MSEEKTTQSGTRVVSTDLGTGESEERVIVNDWCVIVDGQWYVYSAQGYANGTAVITLKKQEQER